MVLSGCEFRSLLTTKLTIASREPRKIQKELCDPGLCLQIQTENHLVHMYSFSEKSDSVHGLNGAQWLRISLAFNDNINSSKQRTEENPERMV